MRDIEEYRFFELKDGKDGEAYAYVTKIQGGKVYYELAALPFERELTGKRKTATEKAFIKMLDAEALRKMSPMHDEYGPMKIITIVNRRGGVGKTATATAIGAGLASKGMEVLFVDLDSQCNLTYDLGADQTRYSSMDLLTGEATAEEVIQHQERWDVIPASPTLATADIVLNTTGKKYRLREALESLIDKYDACIIDTPPSLNIATVNALTAAAGAIIPAQPEVHSIQGIMLLNETVEQVRKYCNKELRIYGILLTRYSDRAIISRDMRASLEDVAKQLNTKVYATPIRECISIKEAQARQQDIFSYAPRSHASEDYTALIDELLRDGII